MNPIQSSAYTTRYDIEADWQINNVCDMACRYCFSTRSSAKGIRPVADPARYLDFFNSTGKVWSLHLTGGEPFLSPGFVELCKVLSQDHFLSLNSNLSSTLVSDFAEEVDPSHVEYVQCCLHLEERNRLHLWSTLASNLLALARRSIFVFASQVMTPETFAIFPQAAEHLAHLGVVLIPKSLQGLFEGKWYPHAYTEEQKRAFRALSAVAESRLGSLAPRLMQLVVTVNPLRDREFLDGFPVFRGAACAAGSRLFTIQSNGNIYRCGSNHLLGNIENGLFEPLSPNTPCDTSYYPYFCLRYSELPRRASGTTPFLMEVPPPPYLQAMRGLLRKGRKMLNRAIR